MASTFADVTSAKASDILGERVKQLRTERQWTAKHLADVCAANGAPELTAPVIANIETGRRDQDGRRRRQVTIDEVLVLAFALDVPPVYLFVPLDGDDVLEVTPEIRMDPAAAVTWATGASAFATLDPDPERNKRWVLARRQLNLLRDAWMALTILDMQAHRRPVTRAERTAAVEQLANIQLGRADIMQLPDSYLTPAEPFGEEKETAVRQILANIVYQLAGFGLTPPPLPEGLIEYVQGELSEDQHRAEDVAGSQLLEQSARPRRAVPPDAEG
jgi:transcriptional regulator with XRE-family HTH domain